MKDVYYTPDALKQADMLDLADHIKSDRTSEDRDGSVNLNNSYK